MVLITGLARRVYRRATEDVLKMSLRQFVTLTTLRDSGGDLMTQQTLAELLCSDANNLVLLLNPLEDAGHLERRRDPTDRRRHIVDITVSGRRALERAERRMESVEDEVLGHLDTGERAQLRALLARAVDGAP
jgi:DNA-binding MarR family transcriptional regulator